MARFFLGNFDFEHRLAEPKRQLPAKLDRINAELATSWLAIADDGDYLWTPQRIDPTFFEQAAAAGLPRVVPVTSFGDVPPGFECVPWGWTDDIRRLCKKHGWQRNDPPDVAVRAANSRRMSAGLENEWRVGLDFSGEVRSLTDIDRLMDMHGPACQWAIKAEFGMSARERIIGTGRLSESQQNWVAKRLAADGAVFFEPWVERLDEVGIQIDVPRDGDPVLIDIVPMLVNDQGQYAGSWFAIRRDRSFERDLLTGNCGVEVALRAARRLQDVGYFGPLGIDVMRYRAADQSIRLRPIQDINARWTMGRLSLGFRRLVKAQGSFGLWYHSLDPSAVRAPDVLPAIVRLRVLLQEIKFTPIHAELIRMILFQSDRQFTFADLVAEAMRLGHSADGLPDALNRILYLKFRDGFVRCVETSPELVGGKQSAHRSFVVF